tara:strand:- start:1137 stop:1646 length:510 start_codon:yes stop_codon:yes gene_type:complete
MDQYKEGQDNPFDAPIPGQSLTDTPGNYPWEHPPQYTDTSEAADFVWDRLHRPEFAEQMIAMLDAGIPVEALGRIIIFNGFMEGKWNPDVAFIIAEPVMKMIATMGMKAGVKNITMSMDDITNKTQIQSIVKTKIDKEETEKAAMGVKQDIKKIEKKGLMAKPEKEEKV